jgi:hypothetical protein
MGEYSTARRSILRQGFIILLLGLLAGFGIVAGGPKAPSWMATHLTLMLTAVLIVLVGLVYDDLNLSPKQRAMLRFAVVADGYWGGLTGVFATLFSVPGPVSGHGAHPTGWAATVFFSVFIPPLTLLPFLFTGLTLFGLRGTARDSQPTTNG